MKIIEITESKMDKMAEYAEKMLRYGGKLMSVIDGVHHGGDYGERGRYGMRYGHDGDVMYRHEMGDHTTHDDDWDDEMHERRRRSSRTGRYM